MQSHTVRLSKPERLKIKKKLSLLMKTPFNFQHPTSPSRIQLQRCRMDFNSEAMIPYPFGIYRGPQFSNDGSFAIPRRCFQRSYTRIFNSQYHESSLIPISYSLYQLGNSENTKCSFGDIEFSNEGDVCSISIGLKPIESAIYRYRYVTTRNIRIRYKISKKELTIKTNLNKDSYDSEKILNLINLALFNIFVY